MASFKCANTTGNDSRVEGENHKYLFSGYSECGQWTTSTSIPCRPARNLRLTPELLSHTAFDQDFPRNAQTH